MANEPPSDSDEWADAIAHLARTVPVPDRTIEPLFNSPRPPSITISVGSLRQAVYDALQNWDYGESTSSDLTDHIVEWIETNAYPD